MHLKNTDVINFISIILFIKENYKLHKYKDRKTEYDENSSSYDHLHRISNKIYDWWH